MKYGNKFFLVLTVLMGTTILASCLPNIVKHGRDAVERHTIKLEVDTSSDELAIRTPGSSRCRAVSPKAGCIAVGKSNTARIKIQLQKSAGWYLTEFKVCLGNNKASQVCDLEEWQQAEFLITDTNATGLLFPEENGVVDLTQLSSELTKFYVFNYNAAKQDFFYTIKACRAADDCVSTDPPIENGGRGRN